jgi:hypothetical protein
MFVHDGFKGSMCEETQDGLLLKGLFEAAGCHAHVAAKQRGPLRDVAFCQSLCASEEYRMSYI